MLTSLRGSSNANMFLASQPGTVFHKILHNNMDGGSFDKTAGTQIRKMIFTNEDLAFFGPKDSINELVAGYKCKVMETNWPYA